MSEFFDPGFLGSQADIIRTTGPVAGKEWLPLYQGNGRFGTCFGPWGLHRNPHAEVSYAVSGTPNFMHLGHYGRGRYNADYLLPLAHIYWDREPGNVTGYRQHQSFFDGTLKTAFQADDFSIKISSWFDHVQRNSMGFNIEAYGPFPAIVVAPIKKADVHYGQHPEAVFTTQVDGSVGVFTVTCLTAKSTLAVWTDGTLEQTDQGLIIRLNEGLTNITLTVNDAPEDDAERSLMRSIDWWHKRWESGTQLQLPDEEASVTWVRSMAYILSSYNDDGIGMAGPCGFSGNAWPFAFPQDLSYIHPVLLSTGNIGIAKAWIENWGRLLDDMKEYTRHLLGVGGLMIPWTTAYGSYDEFHHPKPPNIYYYGLHNSGYLSRMAYETSLAVNDPAWSAEYAMPLILEAAIFYRNILTKGNDGHWHIEITPAIGQDETGGVDQKNYLCAMYSAQYALQTAVRCGLDRDGEFSRILKNGLAFKTLRSPGGIYYTSSGAGADDYGKQKHPVQLNPLAFLPLASSPSEEVVNAYRQRYEITHRASEPFSYGWTLAEFILASARMGDAGEWNRDWTSLKNSDYIDPDLIQFYETSHKHDYAFFVTSHGLTAQAILEGLASEWWGDLRIGSCVPWKGPCTFKNIRMLSGVTVSGTVSDNESEIVLQAWKESSVQIPDSIINLAAGEEQKLTLKGIK